MFRINQILTVEYYVIEKIGANTANVTIWTQPRKELIGVFSKILS